MGATYDDLLAVARRTEETGFDAFFRSDHYLTMGGDGLPGPTDAWVTLGRSGPRDQPDPPGHADDGGHVPAARAAGDLGRPGRPDERRPGRARHRRGLVRGRAHRLRHPVPVARRAVRPLRGAAGDHHRAVGHAAGGDASTSTAATTGCPGSPALPKPVQDGGIPVIVGGAGKKRTPRLAARYAERVQRAVRLGRGQRAAVRRRARGLRGGRPRPVVAGLQLGAGALRRQGRGRGRPPRRGDRPRRRRAARARRRRHAGRGGRRPGPVRRGRRRSGSTCRCSTSPTSTTSTWWPPRWRRSWAEAPPPTQAADRQAGSRPCHATSRSMSGASSGTGRLRRTGCPAARSAGRLAADRGRERR